jgi:hypothetical protein
MMFNAILALAVLGVMISPGILAARGPRAIDRRSRR